MGTTLNVAGKIFNATGAAYTSGNVTVSAYPVTAHVRAGAADQSVIADANGYWHIDSLDDTDKYEIVAAISGSTQRRVANGEAKVQFAELFVSGLATIQGADADDTELLRFGLGTNNDWSIKQRNVSAVKKLVWIPEAVADAQWGIMNSAKDRTALQANLSNTVADNWIMFAAPNKAFATSLATNTIVPYLDETNSLFKIGIKTSAGVVNYIALPYSTSATGVTTSVNKFFVPLYEAGGWADGSYDRSHFPWTYTTALYGNATSVIVKIYVSGDTVSGILARFGASTTEEETTALSPVLYTTDEVSEARQLFTSGNLKASLVDGTKYWVEVKANNNPTQQVGCEAIIEIS
jgi:hypothetical protein